MISRQLQLSVEAISTSVAALQTIIPGCACELLPFSKAIEKENDRVTAAVNAKFHQHVMSIAMLPKVGVHCACARKPPNSSPTAKVEHPHRRPGSAQATVS